MLVVLGWDYLKTVTTYSLITYENYVRIFQFILLEDIYWGTARDAIGCYQL